MDHDHIPTEGDQSLPPTTMPFGKLILSSSLRNKRLRRKIYLLPPLPASGESDRKPCLKEGSLHLSTFTSACLPSPREFMRPDGEKCSEAVRGTPLCAPCFLGGPGRTHSPRGCSFSRCTRDCLPPSPLSRVAHKPRLPSVLVFLWRPPFAHMY